MKLSNILSKTVPLFFLLITTVNSGPCGEKDYHHDLDFAECNASDQHTWCANPYAKGKQSGHCVINSLVELLPSGACVASLTTEQEDDDSDMMLRNDFENSLHTPTDPNDPNGHHDGPDDPDEPNDGPNNPPDPDNDPDNIPEDPDLPSYDDALDFLRCVTKRDLLCRQSYVCAPCIIEDGCFSFCIPKTFFSNSLFEDLCEDYVTPAPFLTDVKPEGCVAHDTENLCLQNKGIGDDSCVWCGGDLDGTCVESSDASDVELCEFASMN